jgi:hypothetical protein
MEESTCRAILAACPNLENWVQKSFEIFHNHIEASNGIFLGPNILLGNMPHILHTDTFPTMQESPQLELICESYASHKLTTIVRVDAMLAPFTQNVWG